jgi:hypothetical protein
MPVRIVENNIANQEWKSTVERAVQNGLNRRSPDANWEVSITETPEALLPVVTVSRTVSFSWEVLLYDENTISEEIYRLSG